MPSGLTHALLTKMLQDKLPDGELRNIFASGTYSLQVGAVAPDIPYASVVDNDFLHNHSSLADDFHYKYTNQIPLQSLVLLKELKDSISKNIHYQMFSFYLGYISHVFADGIFHPYIRDKVGNYNENITEHRELEMKLDVVFYQNLTRASGIGFEINYVKIQDELLNFPKIEGASAIINSFTNLINNIYKVSFTKDDILGSIKGLHRLFNLASGKFPKDIRHLRINTYTYKNFDDIDFKEVTQLRKPKGRDINFLHVEMIDFFENCLPQFFARYSDMAQKAYEFVYNNGPTLSEIDIPLIDLDTGRLLANTNLDEIPALWINS